MHIILQSLLIFHVVQSCKTKQQDLGKKKEVSKKISFQDCKKKQLQKKKEAGFLGKGDIAGAVLKYFAETAFLLWRVALRLS